MGNLRGNSFASILRPAAALLAFALLSPAAFADVTRTLNYQGFLADNNGLPIDVNKDMSFLLYTQATGGSSVFTEQRCAADPGGRIGVVKGRYEVEIGSNTAGGIPVSVFRDNAAVWLEIQVDPNNDCASMETLSPRIRLQAAPYSFNALYATTATYVENNADAVVRADADGNASGAVRLRTGASDRLFISNGGLVGIGTTSPAAELQIVGGVRASSGIVSIGNAGGVVTSGGGHRFMWIPSSGAIRAGAVDSAQWDAANIGAYSVAFGSGTRGSAAASTVGGGAGNLASGQYSVVSGGQGNAASDWHATIGGGEGNLASNTHATVGGGETNTASGIYATVGGGQLNSADQYATVGGGNSNTAANSAAVAGGITNTASGWYSAIGGGDSNTTSDRFATVPGGQLNTASQYYTFAAGRRAKATAQGAFVWADSLGVDLLNKVTDQFLIRARGGFEVHTSSLSFISPAIGTLYTVDGSSAHFRVPVYDQSGGLLTGGVASGWTDDGGVVRLTDEGDSVGIGTTGPAAKLHVSSAGVLFDGNTGAPAAAGGGTRFMWIPSSGAIRAGRVDATQWNANFIGPYSVAFGSGTRSSGTGTTVSGGVANVASNDYSTVGGGLSNAASGQTATVAGGDRNSATTTDATVGGGESNTASGIRSTVAGGLGNTASGSYAAIPGGRTNLASGDTSFAAGRRAKATAQGAFVWADSTNVDLLNKVTDQFLIRAQGGFEVRSSSLSLINPTAGTLYTVDATSAHFRVPIYDQTGTELTGGTASGWTDDGTTVRLTDAGDYVVVQSTLTVQGSAFSVGISTLAVRNGVVTIGTTTALDPLIDHLLEVHGALRLYRGDGTGNARHLSFYKDRSGGLVQNGDELGYVDFYGHDGGAFRRAAGILAEVDGAPGSSDMPGRLMFLTAPDGGSQQVERMRLTSAGYLGVGTPTPGAALHVSSAASSAATPILHVATGALSSQSLLWVQKDGKVGLGVTNPQRTIDMRGEFHRTVQGSNYAHFMYENGSFTFVDWSTDIQQIGEIDFVAARSGAQSTSYAKIVGTASAKGSGTYRGILEFHTTGGSSNVLAERMRVNYDGTVGIGVTSPQAELHVSSPAANAVFRVSTGAAANQTVLDVRGDGQVWVGTAAAKNAGRGDLTASATTWFGLSGSYKVDHKGMGWLERLGLETVNPTSRLTVNGSIAAKQLTVSANHTAGFTDYAIFVNASGGARTITLPAASVSPGRMYVIKKIDSSANIVTIDGAGAETIDGATNYVLTSQYQSVTLISDGAQWWVI